jgi:hypothetical protein
VPDKSEQTNSVKRKKGTQGTDVEPGAPRSHSCLYVYCRRVARLSTNHSPKPTMEEAASLFGPPDSASDPFGNIVTNGSDDHAASSTSPPSEHPPSETQNVDTGRSWFDGSSGHYQAEASLYPEYEWRNSDDAGGHYNTQPHYEGPTPSGFHHQSLNAHGGDNLQYTASHEGEWHPL